MKYSITNVHVGNWVAVERYGQLPAVYHVVDKTNNDIVVYLDQTAALNAGDVQSRIKTYRYEKVLKVYSDGCEALADQRRLTDLTKEYRERADEVFKGLVDA